MSRRIIIIISLAMAVLLTVATGKNVRIIGGENANIRHYPFLTNFRFIDNNLIFCTGSIISTKHILTAAHCLYYENNSYEHIRIYSGITRVHSRAGEIHKIAYVFFYPRFTGHISQSGVNHHDLAIVLVQQPIDMNTNQGIIDIPRRNVNDNTIAAVFGWGVSSQQHVVYPGVLQKASMTIFAQTVCSDIFNFPLHSSQICAYNNQHIGTCVGDGGGPLVNNNKIIGILSYNNQCALGIPDVYTNIYYYTEYILEILRLTS